MCFTTFTMVSRAKVRHAATSIRVSHGGIVELVNGNVISLKEIPLKRNETATILAIPLSSLLSVVYREIDFRYFRDRGIDRFSLNRLFSRNDALNFEREKKRIRVKSENLEYEESRKGML